MTKEELLEKLKEVEGLYSPEEQVKILEEINALLEQSNDELNALYDEVKESIDKEKAKKILENMNANN